MNNYFIIEPPFLFHFLILSTGRIFAKNKLWLALSAMRALIGLCLAQVNFSTGRPGPPSNFVLWGTWGHRGFPAVVEFHKLFLLNDSADSMFGSFSISDYAVF